MPIRIWLFRRRSRSAMTESAALPAHFYFRRQASLMSRAEAQCYAFLPCTYGERYHIGFKVRLADVVDLEKRHWDRSDEDRRLLSSLNQMHVDFLLIESSTHAPVAVIELDGESHGSDYQHARDGWKDEALRRARVPSFAFPTTSPKQRARRRLTLTSLS